MQIDIDFNHQISHSSSLSLSLSLCLSLSFSFSIFPSLSFRKLSTPGSSLLLCILVTNPSYRRYQFNRPHQMCPYSVCWSAFCRSERHQHQDKRHSRSDFPTRRNIASWHTDDGRSKTSVSVHLCNTEHSTGYGSASLPICAQHAHAQDVGRLYSIECVVNEVVIEKKSAQILNCTQPGLIEDGR